MAVAECFLTICKDLIAVLKIHERKFRTKHCIARTLGLQILRIRDRSFNSLVSSVCLLSRRDTQYNLQISVKQLSSQRCAPRSIVTPLRFCPWYPSIYLIYDLYFMYVEYHTKIFVSPNLRAIYANDNFISNMAVVPFLNARYGVIGI